MSLRLRLAALLSVLTLSLPASVRAERDEIEEVEEIASDNYTQHVSIAAGSLAGGLGGNYEYLVARRHGFLAEASYAVFGTASGSWSVGAGYRFHFHSGMEGLFAGPFLRHGEIDTEIPLEEETYGLSGTALIMGANVGYRWQGSTPVTFTLRGGYGIPVIKDFAWSPSEPDQAGLIESFTGLDLELNIGYSF